MYDVVCEYEHKQTRTPNWRLVCTHKRMQFAESIFIYMPLWVWVRKWICWNFHFIFIPYHFLPLLCVLAWLVFIFFMASKSKNIAWVKCWPVLANSYCCCCSWWSKMYGVWEEVHARARMCRKKKETIDSIDRSSKGKKERINKWKEKNRTHAHKRAKRKEVIMNRWLLRFVRSFVGFVQISITSRLENDQRTGFSSLFTFLFANAYSHILTMSLPSPSSSSSCLCEWIGRCQLAPHLSFVCSTLFFCTKFARTRTQCQCQCPP